MTPFITPLAFLFFTVGPARAHQPKNFVPKSTVACAEDLAGPTTTLETEMLSFFQRRNADAALAGADGAPEVIRRVGDGMVVRTTSGLWFVRRTQLNDEPFASERLKGDHVERAGMIGQYVHIVTRAAGKLRYVHLIHESMEQVDFQLAYGSDEVVREFAMPRDRGRILQINTTLVMVNIAPAGQAKTGGVLRNDRLGIFEVRGKIDDVTFPSVLGKFPVAAVDYTVQRAGASRKAIEPHYRSRRVYLDHSGFGPLNDSVEDGVGGATVLMDVPRASDLSVFTNVGATSGQNVAHVFLNTPDRRKQTTVYTWDYQSGRGFRAVPHFGTGVRFDLETLARDKNPPAFISYRATGRALKRATSTDAEYEVFLASPTFPATPDLPFLMARTSVAFDDEAHGGVLIHSFGGRGDPKATAPTTLNHRYAYLSTAASQDASFAFDSTVRFEKVTRRPPVKIESYAHFGTPKSLPFLFAAVNGADGPGYVVITIPSGDVVWMPNLNRIQIVTIGHADKVILWGERRREGQVVPMFAAFNTATRVWQAGDTDGLRRNYVDTLKSMGPPPTLSADALRSKLRHLNQPDPVYLSPVRGKQIARFHRGVPLGTWIDPSLVDIRYLERFNTVLARFGDPQSRGYGAYLIGADTFSPQIFSDVYQAAIEPASDAPDVLVLSSGSFKASRDLTDVTDGIPGVPSFWNEWSPGRRARGRAKYEFSHVTALMRVPGGVVTKQHVHPAGRLETLKFVKHLGNYYALGTTKVAGFARELAGQFRWAMGTDEVKASLINPVAEPLYQDAEYTVTVSRTSSEANAKIHLFPKGDIMGRSIVLTRAVSEANQTKVQTLFDFISNLSGGPKFNTQDLARAWREGDLLFIATKGTPAHGSSTYVYNLRKDEVVVVIPNYQRHFDLKGYRFYIGAADHQFPSIVAVFRQQSNTFETFFDFGQVRIDADAPDAISLKDNQIHFKTTGGSSRVYDLRGRHFLGLIPESVRAMLAGIEGRLGVVWNSKIFGASLPGLFERDDFMTSLIERFPLSPVRGGLPNNLMIVAPDGAGATSILENFVVRYITGEIPARYRPIFFKLNKTTASSDTSYRGTKADKYRDLREAAANARAGGYRLMVIIEGLHRFLPDGQKMSGDEEGDFFGAFRDVMEGADFDVIATVTPAGLEQVQRRKPDFASQFPAVLRLNPLSRASTSRAIEGFLNEEFGKHPVLSPAQREKLIDRVSRLSIHKALPGSAFDVVKRIVPASPAVTSSSTTTSAKRARKPKPVADATLNQEIASRSGVPAILLDREHAAVNREQMRTFLNGRVQGVPHLVDKMVDDVFAFALDLNRPDWPIARHLAVGPTGTGKTELIKAVLDFLYGNHDARLLISGEDFRDVRAGEKLKTMIVRHLIQYPFNVLQLDEFEKMHPDHRNVVLSLGDGEITDAEGKKVSTSLTMLYATSNLGVEDVKRELASRSFGFREGGLVAEDLNKGLEDIYEKALKRELPPEVLNRFEHTLTFPFMTNDIAKTISEAYLNGVGETAVHAIRSRFGKVGYDVTFDETALEYVARAYVDLELGARRLAINVEKNVVKAFLSREALAGRLIAGPRYVISHDGRDLKLSQTTTGAAGL